MTNSSLAFLLVMAASVVYAEDEHWFIGSDAETAVSKATAAAILKAACEGGKIIHGTVCSKCPDSDSRDGGWAINSLITGHFSSATSEEAIIASESCYPTAPGIGIGMLLGKRNGKWIKLAGFLSSREACTRKKLRSGREFLVCESWGYHRDGEVTHTIGTWMVENDNLDTQELFTATDDTGNCFVQKAERAEIRGIEFRDLNGDGMEDISITAAYGSVPMTESLRNQCWGVFEDAKSPQPPVMKTYTIQFLFDGNHYKVAPGSRDAAALFDGTADRAP